MLLTTLLEVLPGDTWDWGDKGAVENGVCGLNLPSESNL